MLSWIPRCNGKAWSTTWYSKLSKEGSLETRLDSPMECKCRASHLTFPFQIFWIRPCVRSHALRACDYTIITVRFRFGFVKKWRKKLCCKVTASMLNYLYLKGYTTTSVPIDSYRGESRHIRMNKKPPLKIYDASPSPIANHRLLVMLVTTFPSVKPVSSIVSCHCMYDHGWC